MGNNKKKKHRHHSNNTHLILPKLDIGEEYDCECEPCPDENKGENEMDPEKMVSEIGSFKAEEVCPVQI